MIKKRYLCEYKDSALSRNSRKFLKEYNKFLRNASLTWSVFPRNFFEQHFLQIQNITTEQLRANFDTFLNERDLRRIFTAPEDYIPEQAETISKLGGRFYGGFWIDSIPSISRTSLLIDEEPVVELDFRAMNVTMMYMMATGEAWDEYPYDNIPLPDNSGMFPKALTKPFFTWCPNVRTRQGAIKTLADKLPNELEGQPEATFFNDTGWKHGDLITASLKKHHEIKQFFFLERGELIGKKLQYRDSEIMHTILEVCLNQGIHCLPIHDAVLVKAQHKDHVKRLMIDVLCNSFGVVPKARYFNETDETTPTCLVKVLNPPVQRPA
jgi:hypothetical protein